ncbi:hypothetical protein Hanom_Chr04g00287771 [Helianthus anomalus]
MGVCYGLAMNLVVANACFCSSVCIKKLQRAINYPYESILYILKSYKELNCK